MNLKEKYELEKLQMQSDAISIKSANDYCDSHLIFRNLYGTSCDSSDRAKARMIYVKKAEREFIEENKHEILALAYKMIIADIGD